MTNDVTSLSADKTRKQVSDKPKGSRRRFLTNPTEGFKPFLFLTLFCAILFLPGLESLPPLDRDEARFAQATAQMLETGDFVDIQFQDQARHKKPAGIHWLQAASVTLFSSPEAREIWAYRVPSVIGAWLTVLLTFTTGATLFSRRTGLIAGGMMAASVLVILEAHQAKTDAVLLFAVMAQQFVLARYYMSSRMGNARPSETSDCQGRETSQVIERSAPPGFALALFFWFAVALGIMIKGPIAALISGLMIAALIIVDRQAMRRDNDSTNNLGSSVGWLARLGWLWGIPLAAALVLPWYLAIGERTAGGESGSFVITALTTDLIPKLLGGQESHGAPPGYYAILMLLFFWPGSLFVWPSLWRAWKAKADPAVRFCLCWLLPAWLMFELIPTKLPHYVLPLYPALALLTAKACNDIWQDRAAWFGPRTLAVCVGLWCLVALALAVAAAYLPIHFGGDLTWKTFFFGIFTLYLLATTGAALRDRVVGESLENSTITGGIMVTMVIWLMVAQFNPMWVSRDAARAVLDAYGDNVPGVTATAGFSEPSLVFLLGTETKLSDGGGAAGHILADPGNTAVVDSRQLPAFRKTLGEHAKMITETAKISGINYSKGKKVDLHIFVHRNDRKNTSGTRKNETK